MVLTTIVTRVYKPTYNWWALRCMKLDDLVQNLRNMGDITKTPSITGTMWW